MPDQRSPGNRGGGRPGTRWTLGLVVAGLVLGLALSGVTVTAVHEANETEFCVSCHVYENFYPEFKTYPHWSNELGVQVSCAECHLPHEGWVEMLWAKGVSGMASIWAYTVGGVNTPEEFAGKRRELAEKVWEQFRENDSRYCRQCHNPEGWDLSAQSRMAQRRHQRAQEEGQTCIECHKGVAHAVPEPEDTEAGPEETEAGEEPVGEEAGAGQTDTD